MKRIVITIIVVALVIIAFFQYKKYRRYNPPSYFEYALNDSIDANYYDQDVVLKYYENAYEISRFARKLWFENGIDINFISESTNVSRSSIAYYKRLHAHTKMLEKKLTKSYELKELGLTNVQIQRMFEEGISLKFMEFEQLKNLKFGDNGEKVWRLQKLLVRKGKQLPLDGLFRDSTQLALSSFQRDIEHFPSGELDSLTLTELIK